MHDNDNTENVSPTSDEFDVIKKSGSIESLTGNLNISNYRLDNSRYLNISNYRLDNYRLDNSRYYSSKYDFLYDTVTFEICIYPR